MSISAAKAALLLIAWSALLGLLLESRCDAKVQHIQRQLLLVHSDLESIVKREVEKEGCQCNAAPGPVFGNDEAATTVFGIDVVNPTLLPAITAVPEQGLSAHMALNATLETEPLPNTTNRRQRGRRLAAFYTVGTTGAGVTCLSFSGTTTQADMNSKDCRGATDQWCQGCFIATADANDKTLDIIKCSTARNRVDQTIDQLTGGGAFTLTVINADSDNTLTVRACSDSACASPLGSYTMSGGDSVTGYCYSGGGNNLYFPNAVFQNAVNYDFTGKTIADLGTITTADINGGTIDGVDITLGAGKTLDLTGSTLTLDDGVIPANKVSQGTFTAGNSYSFSGSTIINAGTVTTIDIDGGTMTGVDVTIPSGKTLDVSAGTFTLADGQIPMVKVQPGTFTVGTYSLAGSTISNLGQVDNVDINTATISNAVIDTSSLNVPSGKTLDVSAGTLNLGANQVPAGAIQAGTFGTGTYYFTGSTLASLGTVTTGDIDGGTIDATDIGQTTAAKGSFTDLKATDYAFSVSVIAAASPTGNTQSGTIFSSETPLLTSLSITSLTITCSRATATTPIVATAGPCDGGGEPTVLDVKPLAGSFTVRVKNVGNSDCTGIFSVHWMILGSL